MIIIIKFDYERNVFFVEEALEGGYTARAIGESIFTEGDTLDELKSNIREAVQCHFDEPKTFQIINKL